MVRVQQEQGWAVHLQLEKSVEGPVVKWSREHGWLAWKLWGFNQVGLPDRLFIFKFPVLVFMEFKRPGGRMRPLQDRIQKELALRGFSCYTVSKVENAIHILQRAMGSQAVPENGDPMAD